MNYQQQADSFLQRNKISFEAKKSAIQEKAKWAKSEEKSGNKFDVIFIKKNEYGITEKSFFLNFWGSIANKESKRANINAYDVLACITKYDVGTLWDFIAEFGYDATAETEKTYFAVKEEWEKVKNFFSEKELEELREIN